MFKEEKSTKVKIHPGAKALLLDSPDIWLQSRQSDFQVGLLGKKATLRTKQVGRLLAASPTGEGMYDFWAGFRWADTCS